MVFFFSSRRRHTRLQGDWSSDVCSSDLSVPPMKVGGETDVVQVLALVEGVDTRVAPHQLLQLVLKHGALKELNGKPAGHAFYEGTLPAWVNATVLVWAHGSVLSMGAGSLTEPA